MSTPKKPRKRRSALPKAGAGRAVDDYSPALPAVIDARTPAEAALVAAHEAATADRTQRAPTMRRHEPDGVLIPYTNDGALWLARMAAAIGVSDLGAQVHLVQQAASVFWQGAADTNANAAIALIREIAPRNGAEALLVTQMVAVHNAALELLRRVLHPDQPAQFIDSLSNRATRLLRLYVDQLEALDRLRGGGGRQTVRVERVTVEAGGQAVVGAVTTAPAAGAPAARQDGGAPDA